MIKTYLLTIIFAFSTALTAQKATFNIKYSENLAVFVFVQNLSENYQENIFRTEFLKSKYNTEKFKNLISKFSKLKIDYSYEFDEFPKNSKTPLQTRDLLRKNLIESDNLTDFKIRSIGLLPSQSLNDITETIAAFTPIYNELIYNPNKEAFENRLVAITKYAADNKIDNYLDIGLQFYNSSWDNSVPFKIAFYPLPNSKGFTATAFCNNFLSAIQTGLTDYKGLFSVMLHEIYHIIFNEQSLEVKIEIAKYFKENSSKSSNYAYHLLNEVLATALGNGYVFEKLDGKLDSEKWYNRKYINLMAKQIYPFVNEYISQKKPIDKIFIDNYIKQYEENFPDWINDLDNILAYRYVISSDENDFDVIDSMFRYNSVVNYETDMTKIGIEKMKNTSLTKLIIISSNSNEKLKIIKSEFPELKNWTFNSQKEFSYTILLNDKSQLIVINKKTSTTKALIEKVVLHTNQKY